MLEANISLIATKLPSPHFVATKEPLYSLVASICRNVSLASIQSRRSESGTEAQFLYSKMLTEGSMWSDVQTIRDERDKGKAEAGFDTFTMYDTEHAAENRAPGVVHV